MANYHQVKNNGWAEKTDEMETTQMMEGTRLTTRRHVSETTDRAAATKGKPSPEVRHSYFSQQVKMCTCETLFSKQTDKHLI